MKESGWKQRSSEATTTRRRDDSIRGQNGVRNWGELVQEPRAAVSSFQISGRYRVYARQGSAKRVESRAKGTSFYLTADCPDPFSLSSSFLRLSFSSLSSSLTIPPSLSDFALSFSLYAHRSSHLRPPSTLSSLSYAHPPLDFARVLTGSSISTWTYGKLVETPLGRAVSSKEEESSLQTFSDARSIGRN